MKTLHRAPATAAFRTLMLALLAGTAAIGAAHAEPVMLTVALAANPQMETAANLIDNFYGASSGPSSCR